MLRVRHFPTILAGVLLGALIALGCSKPEPAPLPQSTTPPNDAQHVGITAPHGDHSPHHAGLVLMNGDVHYEVVMHTSGKYEVWFTDAVRTELPASVASRVRVEVTRPQAPPEAQPAETPAADPDRS